VLAEERDNWRGDGAESCLTGLQGCESLNFEIEFGGTLSVDTFGHVIENVTPNNLLERVMKDQSYPGPFPAGDIGFLREELPGLWRLSRLTCG
jgi:hypothetical protein